MDSQNFRFWQRRAISRLIVLVLVSQTLVPAFAAAKDNSNNTRTPIKHVIVIIGENRTFDHVFATYKPKKGETVANLLSKHIINEDGTPGPNYFFASQFSAVDTDKFQISPGERTLFSNLPTPLAGWANRALLRDGSRGQESADRIPCQLLQIYDHRRNGASTRSARHPYFQRNQLAAGSISTHVANSAI